MFSTTTLPNGSKIVMEKIPFVRSVSFGIWVKNGSRNENDYNNGISHFIEHMLFKGTKTRTARQIADEFDAIGGQLNAYTSKEITCYYTRVLDTNFDAALDVLSDMFFNSTFSDDDIEKERNVILEEINMTEDSPEELVTELLQKAVFASNPLKYTILGSKENILSFDHNTFSNYFNGNYCPENTVIAIAGNFDEGSVLKKIEKYFSNFPQNAAYSPPEYNVQYSQSFVKTEKDIEQLHLCLAFPGISLCSEETYTMSVLNTLFGGGMSSRLFQNIREKHGLVYSIYSYNYSFSDTGLFVIYAALSPNQVKKTVSLITGEIKNLYADKFSLEYLNRAKEQLKSNLLLSLESSSSRMSSIGRSQLMLNRLTPFDELIGKIDGVNIEKLHSLIEKIFVMENMSISAVGKVKGMSLEGLVL